MPAELDAIPLQHHRLLPQPVDAGTNSLEASWREAAALSSYFRPNPSCNQVSISLTSPAVNRQPPPTVFILEGQCAGPRVCPLSRVQAGTTVCIKRLSTAPELTDRLRELGFGEEQIIKLIACESSFICQVCNARLGISRKLADAIMVEAVPASAA